MHIYSSLVVPALLSTVGLAASACASKPSHDVQSANEARAQNQREYSEERAELNREQQDRQAQTNRKTADENADLNKEHSEKLSGSNQDLSEARAKMMEDRRGFLGDVDERLAKTDAKAQKEYASAKRGAEQMKAQDGWNRYQQARQLLLNKRDTIYSVPDEAWAKTRSEIDDLLDQLDKTASSMTD